MAKQSTLTKYLRENFTQDELRAALGYQNCSSICRKLNGERNWTVDDAKKLVKLFPNKVTLAMVRPDIFEKE